MTRKVTGYKVEVEVNVATDRWTPLSEERRIDLARRMAEDLVDQMKRHIDDVNPRFLVSGMRDRQDHYVAYVVPVYEEEGEE